MTRFHAILRIYGPLAGGVMSGLTLLYVATLVSRCSVMLHLSPFESFRAELLEYVHASR